MIELVLLALSAALGAVIRGYIVSLKLFDRFSLPYGTFTVNVLGAFMMGLCMPIVAQESLLYFMIIFGFLGGLTTYSAFTLDQLRLFEAKAFKELARYTFTMMFFCLVALALGLLIGVSF
ncbi:fluoride efflux transporter FluC [Salinicoccus bachuensis]|uniref:Fluoride-specific ion channel FluC n=1 Tax=Salinicoccus bachuensis TaxID=3136731 RepID=A0ABZ3CEY5_9STAP